MQNSAERTLSMHVALPHVFDPFAPTDVDTISETVSSLVDLVYDRGFHAIDFTRIEPDEVNGEHLAAVLRMTSANRILVKGWKHALCVARKALHRQNANIANVLVGLTD